MATKKKATKKSKAKPRAKKAQKSSSYFVYAPAFKKTEEWENNTVGAELGGPYKTPDEALAFVDKKVELGCKRTSIKVVSGHQVKVEVKLR